jgi:hypothetical protein
MPKRELKYPHQVTQWLAEWGVALTEPASLVLIGSGGLLWHISNIGLDEPLLENSMDVDPITDSEAVAELAYDALIGSEFESKHGWHVNLMPRMVLDTFPIGWEERVSVKIYGHLIVTIPHPKDLLAPKMKRNEPRDQQHIRLATKLHLI